MNGLPGIQNVQFSLLLFKKKKKKSKYKSKIKKMQWTRVAAKMSFLKSARLAILSVCLSAC